MTLETPLQLASINSGSDTPRLRQLARELREWAIQSKWSELREKLIHAADSLEVQAVELDAGY